MKYSIKAVVSSLVLRPAGFRASLIAPIAGAAILASFQFACRRINSRNDSDLEKVAGSVQNVVAHIVDLPLHSDTKIADLLSDFEFRPSEGVRKRTLPDGSCILVCESTNEIIYIDSDLEKWRHRDLHQKMIAAYSKLVTTTGTVYVSMDFSFHGHNDTLKKVSPLMDDRKFYYPPSEHEADKATKKEKSE